MELGLFEEVAEALRGFAPAELGALRCRPRRWGIKAWYGPAEPPKEHYEAQVIGADHVDGARVLAVEIGFHAEHRSDDDNDAALGPLVAAEPAWRKVLGDAPVAGPFLGGERSAHWRRLSETWPDPDLDDPDLGVEVALRLVDYLVALEPLRRPVATGR